MASVSMGAAQQVPGSLPGFSGAQPGLVQGGALQQVLDKNDETCDSAATYSYTDGASATQGLQGWYAQESLQTEIDRREEGVAVWGASNDDFLVLGMWTAPQVGRPGTLQLCLQRYSRPAAMYASESHHTTRIPIKLIVWLLAGLGGLGSAFGGFLSNFKPFQRPNGGNDFGSDEA